MENTTAMIHSPVIESAANNLNRLKSWLIFAATLLTVLLIGAVLTFHGYIAWTIARPVIPPLTSNPLQAAGLPYEDVRFASSDGASVLDGWYIPAAGSKKTVVFSHGYGGNREELWVPFYSLAKELNKRQYNVLLFDYSYVRPEVLPTGGVRESLELQGALDFAKEKGSAQTYVWGFSMGAGTALQTALNSRDITAMVLDSTFLLEPDTMFQNIRQVVDLPRLSLPLIRWFIPLLNGTSMKQIPYETVKHTDYPMPILFIHGMMDAKAPYDIVQTIFANQSPERESGLWLLPNGRHELIYKVNKKEYLKRALTFLEHTS
ncbi:alpha/beta hydrolase [Paenibacillus sp. HJGM_3]|uniref:alpha/beta hydrolase n=1 Tax=Paenibacillus sp. HJGM_3 TaxID=3379816 RepID=UPI00385EFE63